MREIEFRGKDLKTGNWVYGDLLSNTPDGKCYIQPKDYFMDPIEVDKETIGQYTGLKDNHNNRLYENDFVIFHKDYFRLIKYSDVMAGYISMYKLKKQFYPGCEINHYDDFEVVGNIFDNPELLEAENDD